MFITNKHLILNTCLKNNVLVTSTANEVMNHFKKDPIYINSLIMGHKCNESIKFKREIIGKNFSGYYEGKGI